MQKTLQIPLEKNTSTDMDSQQIKLKFDKEILSKFKSAKLEFEAPLIEVLIALIMQRRLPEYKIEVEPSEWFEISPDVRWVFNPFKKPPPLEETLPYVELFKREKEAFLRIKNDLLEREMHLGEFVAVHDGEIVDHDRDNVALAQRVYARFGYMPIYIDKVEREREVIELPSPEG